MTRNVLNVDTCVKNFRKILIVRSDFSSEFPRFSRLRSILQEYSAGWLVLRKRYKLNCEKYRTESCVLVLKLVDFLMHSVMRGFDVSLMCDFWSANLFTNLNLVQLFHQ